MTSTKIHSTHCERTAFVYVRQSTWLQVLENRESTERQYNLRDRAIELGWPASRVEVIDEDQGRSGSTATFRTGFQRLAAEVGLGKVGTQQQRLVSAHRDLWNQRHAHRGRRRRVQSSRA
jgi:DNA invertase Pin-like site-specific DNA recombinase